MSLSRVDRAIDALRSEGLSTETVNHHIRAVKAFARWCWIDGRTRDHQLVALSATDPEADRTFVRRALSPEEQVRLVAAAEHGPVAKRMSGVDRAMCYRTALGTGFRVDELRSLTPGSFLLDRNQPVVVCEAAYTKNGRRAEQPIPQALADALRPWLATRADGRPVFGLPPKPAEMLRIDLRAAGVPHETTAGVVDFHALRVAYVSALVASGASVKTCQVLARHHDPALTIGIYAKASLHDIAGTLESLPDLIGPTTAPEAARVTGTDGRINRRLVHPLPTARDGNRRNLSDSGVMVPLNPQMSMVRETPEMAASAASWRVRSDGVREARGAETKTAAGERGSPAAGRG